MEIPYNSEFMTNIAKAESSKNILKSNPDSPKELQKATEDFEAVLLRRCGKQFRNPISLKKATQPKYMRGLCYLHYQKKWQEMEVWVSQKYFINNLVKSINNHNPNTRGKYLGKSDTKSF